MGLNDLLQRHLQRPVARYISTLRARARHVNEHLDGPAALDQYPGRRIPYIYTRTFRVDGPVAARRFATGTAPERTATVANPNTFVLPREGPIRVGRNGTFIWTRASTSVYLSLTYKSEPRDTPVAISDAMNNGDLFDPTIPNDGGGIWCGGFSYVSDPATLTLQPTVSYDIGLLDKKRGAYLHSGERLPVHLFSGQRFANRMLAQPADFDANSEIEVRLFINEIRMGTALDSVTALAASKLKTYIFVNLIGYIEQTDNYASDTGV